MRALVLGLSFVACGGRILESSVDGGSPDASSAGGASGIAGSGTGGIGVGTGGAGGRAGQAGQAGMSGSAGAAGSGGIGGVYGSGGIGGVYGSGGTFGSGGTGSLGCNPMYCPNPGYGAPCCATHECQYYDGCADIVMCLDKYSCSIATCNELGDVRLGHQPIRRSDCASRALGG